MDIALELLEEEHARLIRDHYDTAVLDPHPAVKACDGCTRATQARREIEVLKALQALKEATSNA